MNKKVYYRYRFKAMSALSLGGADSIETDSDVAVDGAGRPFVPASSLAGVFRSTLSERDAALLLGDLEGNQSRIRIYDAVLSGDASVSVRDNVRLEKDAKIAARGGKFDYQVVDAGAQFTGILEVCNASGELDSAAYIKRFFELLNSGMLRIGSKKTRGLGRVAFPTGAVERVSFGCDQVDAWLAFDAFDEESWENAEVVRLDDAAPQGLLITLDLSVKGALSIRQYTTEALGPEASPDYRQLALASSGEPLIPGTTWAGAFRSAYRKVSPCSESDLFGSIEGGASLSRIVFSESIVKGGEWKQITRNAIDRYTGGVIDGALFTELTHFGGSTTLELYVDKPRTEWIATLVSLVADLHNGFLSVGGLTAVGHGLFSINSAKMLVGGVDVRSFSDVFCHPGDLVCPNVSAIVDEAEALLAVGSE